MRPVPSENRGALTQNESYESDDSKSLAQRASPIKFREYPIAQFAKRFSAEFIGRAKNGRIRTGRGQFYDRMDLVRQIVILTIEHRWSVGCGPGGVPYRKCADDFWIEQ